MAKGEKIALLMGGDSSEREISLKSGSAILKALKERGYDASPVDVRDELKLLCTSGFDKAFIALHGSLGEDGSIQGMLEMLKLPYTGSGVLASAATMDKVFAKMVMLSQGIPTPDFRVLSAGNDALEAVSGLEYPLIVKPVSEGSTIGLSKVESESGLKYAVDLACRYGDRVLVERFVKGREVTAGIIGGKSLPLVEVVPKKGLYDYEAKYTKGMTEYIVPARIDEELAEKVSRIALSSYNLFGCRGAARVDVMLGEDGPAVLEINTVPGMTETSLLPMAAKEAGISFGELVETIIEGAALDNVSGSSNRRTEAANAF